MAKKHAKKFSMAEEIRNLLRENPSLSGREVYQALQQKFPNETINENSCGVAFSSARKQLGISGGRSRAKKVVKRVAPAARVARKASAAGGSKQLDLATLQAAAKYLSQAGSADAAIEAIRQVQALQVD